MHYKLKNDPVTKSFKKQKINNTQLLTKVQKYEYQQKTLMAA